MNMVYSTIKCGVSNPISRHKKGLMDNFHCIKPIVVICLETQHLIQFRTPS